MPWLNTRPMDQKIAFIKEALKVRRGGFKALCDVYKISRKTGYKWLARYRVAQSVTGLEERSRRPKKSPKRIKEGLEERILGLRKPDGWGARKIAYLLCKEGIKVSVATVHRTLLRHGEVHRLDRHTPAPGRFERCEPNELFQADFKGPMGRAGAKDEPLTILDDHSRYALGVFALRDHSLDRVKDCFTQVFQRYGLPKQLLLDHGTPWWNCQNGWGLSRLSVFFIENGIELIFGRIAHPQTHGKIERFHQTLSRSMTRQGLPERWEEFQGRYDSFVDRYNNVRPHESLEMKRPADRYHRSPRSYTGLINKWAYPKEIDIKQVDAAGTLRIDGRRYFVCEALTHKEVGVERVGNNVLIRFRDMYIREINLEKGSTLSFVHHTQELDR